MIMNFDHIVPSGGQVSTGAAIVRTAARETEVSADTFNGARSDRADAVKISETGQDLFAMEKAKEALQEYTGWGNFTIDFALDEETQSLVISIVDRDTGEVMRQIPPDEILALRSHLQELLKDALAESA